MNCALRPAAALLSLALALPAGAEDASADPMAAWKPPAVRNEQKDRKEIAAFLARMEEAGKKGDLAAAASLVDFPVTMITDDSKGEAGGEAWSREQWEKVMRPFYEKPAPPGMITHAPPTVVLITDSLASVVSAWTMKMGGKTVRGKSAMLLVRRGGEWKAKAMMEGGWGDAPVGGGAEAASK